MSKKKRREIPNLGLPIIETHCHLDYLKEFSAEEILEKSRELNVEKVITIAVSPDNLADVVSLSSTHENVYCTQGIHPHEAKLYTDAVHEQIKSNLSNEKVLAVGEIGLDFHYNNSPKEVQIEVFKRQLQLAIDFDMPVVIHTRDADPETIEVLSEYAPKMNKKGVIHSFTSSIELAKFCLDQGFHLGFNGIITFNSAQNVRDVLDITPLDKILVETDAPFLTPVPYRGRENAPYFLPFVVEKIAEVKNAPIEEVLKTTYNNALEVFNL